MLVFKINESHVKDLMNKILKDSVFDKFEVRNIEICNFTKFKISGLLDKKFVGDFIEDDISTHCTWGEIKPYALNIIKGTKKPTSIKIVFSLPHNQVFTLHNNARAMFLNFNFENDEVIFRTASTEKEFKMDKNINIILNNYIIDFFKANNIIIDILE